MFKVILPLVKAMQPPPPPLRKRALLQIGGNINIVDEEEGEKPYAVCGPGIREETRPGARTGAAGSEGRR